MNKKSEKNWKEKAVSRSAELKLLKKEWKRQHNRAEFWRSKLAIYDACKDKIAQNAPNFDALVASSDIIEAIFGKLKHRMPKNPKAAFSANSLLIPLFTKDLTQQDVANALLKTAFSQLTQWKNDFLNVRKYISFRNVFN